MKHPGKCRSLTLLLALAIGWVLVACGPPTGTVERPAADPLAEGSCGLELPLPVTDQEAIAALLKAEGVYVVRQDIHGLMRLWAQDGRIADAKHTPDDPQDDQVWQGADAIRHRYVRWVFPGAPALAQPADVAIDVAGERATVTGTTRIGDEVSPAGDRWQVVKIEGCWVFQELVFNLEPP